MGLEFLDVTGQVHVELIDSNSIGGKQQEDVYKITNNSPSTVDTHLLLIARGLSPIRSRWRTPAGSRARGDPYLRVFLPNGVLLPGQSIVETLRFKRDAHAPPVSFSLVLLSGQGNP